MRAGWMLPAMSAGLLLTVAGAHAAPATGLGTASGEASAAAAMKVSVADAIATAERQTGGKAYDAGVGADGKGQIVVETNGPKGVQTVVIDGTTGQVVGGHAGGEPD